MSDAAFYTCGYTIEFRDKVWAKRREEARKERIRTYRERIRRQRELDARRQARRRERERKEMEKVRQEREREREEIKRRDARTMNDIIRKWEAIYDLPEGTIKSESRKKDVVKARDHAIAECYTMSDGKSMTQIGKQFNRDHSSIHHSVKKMGVYDPKRGAKYRAWRKQGA